MNSILVIQTAFLGDVVLATGVLEELHRFYPNAHLDILVRKGNEGLLTSHPFIRKVIVWNKSKDKYKNLFQITKRIRSTKYDAVVNLQRFAASGLLTIFSGASYTAGFSKNPFSFGFSHKALHEIGNGLHEIERNQLVIREMVDTQQPPVPPRLYPSEENKNQVASFQQKPYIVIAPASVWYTKQVPQQKWIELIEHLNGSYNVYLIGAPGDFEYCEYIRLNSPKNVTNLSGELSLLESAALMEKATMNYVNDSAPLHIATAVQAPVTAFFCSTIPEFGFGPLNANGKVGMSAHPLECRPCGLHGLRACPKQHFKCAHEISMIKFAI